MVLPVVDTVNSHGKHANPAIITGRRP